VAFGLPGAAGPVLMGRSGALLAPPPEFADVSTRLADSGGPEVTILWSVAAGLALGSALGVVSALWARRRGRAPFGVGRTAAVMPRARSELPAAALLGVSAAAAEELFFRLAVPLAFVRLGLATGWAFAAATLLFAAMHRYQGAAGVAATGVLGAGLALLYLAGGPLWLLILIHAVVNLNALVLRPALAGTSGAAALSRPPGPPPG